MEAHRSFHEMYSWKLMEVMEASTSTDSGNSHVFPWKLALTSMGVNLLPPTSMEIPMEVSLLPPTSTETSMEVSLLPWIVIYFHRSFTWKLVETSMEIDRKS